MYNYKCKRNRKRNNKGVKYVRNNIPDLWNCNLDNVSEIKKR